MSFRGAQVGTTATVEWAASLTDAGRTNWHILTNIVVTSDVMTNDIPMFFRVRGTLDEWEYAARGGVANRRFHWGDIISHTNANFKNDGGEEYATGTTGQHPDWPNTSPVGSFEPNDYGLFDMIGNVGEYVWRDSVSSTVGSWARNGGFSAPAASCRIRAHAL
jgi:hypothetical protein